MEYIFVWTRTWRYSSQDQEFEDGPPWCWAQFECEATVEGSGTANLSSLVVSPTVKSISEKCRLQTYCLYSILIALHHRACQVSPPIAEACVKIEPANIKMKLLFLWSVFYVTFFIARWTPYVTQTIQCVLLVTKYCSNTDSVSNIRQLLKLCSILKIHNVDITV